MTEPLSEHYAIVERDTITNIVICDDPSYAASQGWYCLEGQDPLPWIGWTYDAADDTWSPPPEPVSDSDPDPNPKPPKPKPPKPKPPRS